MAKHLSLEDRNLIAQRLNEGCSFKAIVAELVRNFTSISREVHNLIILLIYPTITFHSFPK